MKTQKFIILGLVVLSMLSLAKLSNAYPPSDINLKYDLKGHILTVEAYHPSRKLDKHYIRKVEIYKNNEEPIIEYFTRQNKPSKFEHDFNINAKPGDSIKVTLYASEGGEKSDTIDITEPLKD